MIHQSLIAAAIAAAVASYAGPGDPGKTHDRRTDGGAPRVSPTAQVAPPAFQTAPPAVALPSPAGQTFSRPSSTFSTAPGSFSRPAPPGLDDRAPSTIPPAWTPSHGKRDRPEHPRRHTCGPRCGNGRHYHTPIVIYHYGGFYEKAGILDGWIPAAVPAAEILPQEATAETVPQVQEAPPVVIDLPPGARIIGTVPPATAVGAAPGTSTEKQTEKAAAPPALPASR